MRKGFGTRSPWTIAFFLLLLGVVLVFVRFNLGDAFHLILRGERAVGELERVNDAQGVIKFRTADGAIVRRRLHTVARRASENPEILYDGRNPMHFILRSERDGPIVLFAFLLLGACVLLARGLRQYVLLARGRPK